MKKQNIIIIAIVIIMAIFLIQGNVKKEATYVQFRTTSDIYGSGTGIALSLNCGNELTAYGYVGTSTYDCLSSDIVITTNEGYPICTRTGYTDRVYLMKGTSASYFNIDDSDADDVLTSPISINPSLEVFCSSDDNCEDTYWSPSTETECSGQSFTQISNCGTTRSSTGTKDCSISQTCSDLKQVALNGIVEWAVCVN